MISGAFVFQSLTLHPTANPVDPSRKADPFTITPVVRPLKTPSVAFWRKKRKKTRKHQAKPEKRVRIVFRALHNYARKRCALDFDCSEGRTGQNDKFSPPWWKVLHGDFSSHLPHGIFVTFQKKAHQNQPDTLCFCQRGFRVTALLIRSLQLLMTGIQSRPEHPGYSLPDMQPE